MDNTSADDGRAGLRAWHFAALLGGNAALAIGPWLVRLADTGPVSAAFWRITLALPVIALLAVHERRRSAAGPIPRGIILMVLMAGAFFAVDLGSWHIGIEATRLGNATLFGNSGSLLLMIWGAALARRMPAPREWLAIAAALCGAAILLGRSLEISAATLTGDLFCIAAGVCYAFYLIPAQRARASLGPWQVLAIAGTSAAPLLLLGAILLGEPLWPGDWTPVAILAVSSQLLGQGLLVYSLRHFSALIIGLALLTQPAIAAAIGWFVFSELLTAMDVLGMALLGGALFLGKTAGKLRALSRHAQPEPATSEGPGKN